MIQPAHLPSGKPFTTTDIEALANMSSEEEREKVNKVAKKGRKRLSSLFWKSRGVAVAVVAA